MVLYGKSLLAQGVAHLLETDQSMEVTLANIDQEDPMEAILSTNPDVLILDVNNLKDMGGFLTRLLKGRPVMSIVGLDSAESAIYILWLQQRAVKDSQEFLAVMRDEI